MNRLLVYFHGFGSSSKTAKVESLKTAFPKDIVVAFDANIDPEIAILEVSNKIDDALLTDFNSISEVIFIGTSLGGWLAGTLAREYDVRCILINTAFDPKTTLKKYSVSEEIRNKYIPLDPIGLKAKYFFAANDETIDNSEIIPTLKDVTVVIGADHRFETHFQVVINILK